MLFNVLKYIVKHKAEEYVLRSTRLLFEHTVEDVTSERHASFRSKELDKSGISNLLLRRTAKSIFIQFGVLPRGTL